MKKSSAILLICLLSLVWEVASQNALSQYLPTSGGEVVYTRVHELEEMTISDHLISAERWFADYRFPSDRINSNDPNKGIISGNGSIRVLWGPNSFEQYFKVVRFSIELVVKSDRYQYRLDQFVVSEDNQEAQLEAYQSGTKMGARYNPAFYREANHKIELMIRDLEIRMSQN